ncbi:hypothetical protein TMatcc_000195 [Talaromyces marneffei ATCC 18224]
MLAGTDLATVLRDLIERRICDIEILRLRAKSDYSLDFVGTVRVSWYDEKAGEEIRRNAVGCCNISGAFDNGVAPIRSENNDGCDRRLECAVQFVRDLGLFRFR